MKRFNWTCRRVTHWAYGPQDAHEWVDPTGRFIVRMVLAAFGVPMTPHFYALELVDGRLLMLGRHRKYSAAARTCRRQAWATRRTAAPQRNAMSRSTASRKS